MAVRDAKATPRIAGFPGYRAYLLPVAAGIVGVLFLAAPWSLDQKAHAALHGLCAQRPSHSFTLGDRTLPFDGRMTGIYGGFLVTSLYLLARGRYRASRLPSVAAIGLLGLFVATLAIDGTNSLLIDLGLPPLYPPDNDYRLTTGLVTGIALAVIVCFLVSTTLWRRGRPTQRTVEGWEMPLLLALQVPFALAVRSGGSWLYAPVTLWLLISATAVVTALMLVIVVLFQRREGSFLSVAQLQDPAAVALLLAVAVMAGIAGGRFLLEHVTNAPPLT